MGKSLYRKEQLRVQIPLRPLHLMEIKLNEHKNIKIWESEKLPCGCYFLWSEAEGITKSTCKSHKLPLRIHDGEAHGAKHLMRLCKEELGKDYSEISLFDFYMWMDNRRKKIKAQLDAA